METGKETKLFLRDVLALKEALDSFKDVKIPVKASYWLGKIAEHVEREAEAFNRARNKLIQETGQKAKDPAGKEQSDLFNIPPDKIEAFNAEVEELLNEEITIPVGKFSLALFGEVDVPAGAFRGLHKFFSEE